MIDVRAHRVTIGDEIDANIARVVEHGKWIMGPEVAEFEAAVESFVGDESVHAISCANGTDALVLAMAALGIGPGQAVICPSFTFVATAEAVATLGGVPIFADVEEDGFNICPDSARLAAKAAEAADLTVVGICAVDLFGLPADYRRLDDLAQELGLWLLADSAQSFGADSRGTRVGALATATTTSFFPAKPLGCYGDGGMVLTRDAEIRRLITSLRVHGKGDDKYDNVRIGQNSRLDTLQAAILLPKLRILPDEIDARNRVAERYRNHLSDVVTVPMVAPNDRSAWAQFTVETDRRDHLQDTLRKNGIGCAVYYPKPLHHQTGYRRFHIEDIDLTRSERLAEEVISLPMHPYLTEAQVDRVIAAVRLALD